MGGWDGRTRQLRGLIVGGKAGLLGLGLGDEVVVGIQGLSVDVVGEEVGDGGEVVLVVVGHEFVVAVGEHFVGKTPGEREGGGAEVVVNGIGTPAEEKGDDVFVNFGAKEGGGTASAEGAHVDFGWRDACDVFHIFGGEAQSRGELVRGEGNEPAAFLALVFVVAVEGSRGGAMIGDDFKGNAFERADGADWLVGGSFVSDHVTFGGILLVVEPEATEVDGRVITRGRCGVDDVGVVFMEEVGVFQPERFGLDFLSLVLAYSPGRRRKK